MESLTTRLAAKLPDGTVLRCWERSRVINIGGQGRALEPADVEALRAALDEAGYEEVKSWIASEGASWLSDGIQTVSIEIREKA